MIITGFFQPLATLRALLPPGLVPGEAQWGYCLQVVAPPSSTRATRINATATWTYLDETGEELQEVVQASAVASSGGPNQPPETMLWFPVMRVPSMQEPQKLEITYTEEVPEAS